MNENETLENDTDLSVETTTTTLSRKAIILAGSVAGIIIAGGFAFLKNRQTDEEVVEITEEVVVEIDADTDTDPAE